MKCEYIDEIENSIFRFEPFYSILQGLFNSIGNSIVRQYEVTITLHSPKCINHNMTKILFVFFVTWKFLRLYFRTLTYSRRKIRF